ncbi:MAG: M6 family metalloprotease domain-containing protein, partial [Candidatus Krumholzibacteriota bacterium]|nr:M6 family metalloprotease domain-containing protein [Candidatus Krumholzibacteriota bacterium]
MKRFIAAITMIAAVSGGPAGAQIVPPAPGVQMPDAYFEHKGTGKDKNAFRFRHAWIHKTEQIRRAREAYIEERGFYNRSLVAAGERAQYSVTGTVTVPVFAVEFSNRAATYPASDLQTRLFDGPFSPRTLTDFYSETSYGDVTMTGNVFGWYTLPQTDTYYEGGCNGIFCSNAKIGELIHTTLGFYDPSVDFGDYDNDGPDGIPNSGDDDGFVDFVAFVHSESGAECGGSSNIWSHRASLDFSPIFWPQGNYTTNDNRFGGGSIVISDYVIVPAFNCSQFGGGTIDIGVFCHEFGHAFGLPDLYDVSNSTEGVGYWGLMGAGNWNTPPSPAHMSAWSKAQLGWVSVMDVDGTDTQYSVSNVEFNRTVYRLGVMEERWRRMTACAISGSYSMRCGLTSVEGAARNWISGDGYGDEWRERLVHDFQYSGSGTVRLLYGYTFATEPSFDFAYVRIEVDGTVSTIRSYTGSGFGAEDIDITPYLSGIGQTSYRISFEFESDVAWSDRDGSWPTSCGPFVVDNIVVTGGGENHAATFETREDGWYADMTDPAESFYLTNRQPVGSDGPLRGGGGVVIWHINDDVARTGQGGNSGGGAGLVRGVWVEQADGLDHLFNKVNRGDGGDPFPGSTNNMLFNNATTPNSLSETGNTNNVSVQILSSNPLNGDPMDVFMRGGWPAPTWISHTPDNGGNDEIVVVDITGTGLVAGCEVDIVRGGTTVMASPVEWLGKDAVTATLDLRGVPEGAYDVVLRNPGGAAVTVPSAFTVNSVVPTGLREFSARHVNATVELQWVTIDDIDMFVFHQASKLVLDSLARSLGIDESKVYSNLNEVGNTVSAS